MSQIATVGSRFYYIYRGNTRSAFFAGPRHTCPASTCSYVTIDAPSIIMIRRKSFGCVHLAHIWTIVSVRDRSESTAVTHFAGQGVCVRIDRDHSYMFAGFGGWTVSINTDP
ncbi:hypothetical protein Zmor_022852 [Zophobas morio]|uniref:Uncharacterized protein n=1 Tax=Zophobas morio TaxID=2755281 RepID=A0AA38M6F6_9CUCU|nr:hypothetical protein Zmor_022852 [Zophobas morio]